MVSRILLCTYRAPWPGVFVTTWPEDLCGIFSAKLLERHIDGDLFGIFSAKLLDGVIEDEVIHEAAEVQGLREDDSSQMLAGRWSGTHR